MSLPNTTTITVNKVVFYYSYQTLVAIRGNGRLAVMKNYWSTTTGKHLNNIDKGDKKNRLDRDEFNQVVKEICDSNDIKEIPYIWN